MRPPAASPCVRAALVCCIASFLLAGHSALAGDTTSAAVSMAPGDDNPIAAPAAVVLAGHARFTVLTPQLIRMEWAADGKFEDHPSFVFLNRRLPALHFTQHREANRLTIETEDLRLTYDPETPDDGKFTAQNLSVTLTLNGKPVTWRPGMADTGNLQGTTRTLDGALGDKTREPIGQGLLSRDGWSLIDDSTRPLFDSDDFTFAKGEQSPWPWVLLRPPGDRQDWYFFGYGHDYKQALGDFVRVAGRIPLPPRFAFGVWWSRYWAYSDQELDNLVHGFDENDTPLNVLVIDMDWHINRQQLEAMHETDQSGQSLGWTGYTWNPLLFPDPKPFLDNLHRQGLKVTLNLHPAGGIEPWEQAYPAMARAMGIDPATKKYVPFDPTSKQWATNYFKLVLHPLEREGIDFWWLDWQQELNTKLPGVNNTWWLNYLHFSDQEREGKRPLLFHRWGGLGNHRYQIGFSGDVISSWSSLAFQPWFTSTASNVGYAYWSHDIGGHIPGPVSAELYTRWIQFGAYSPILRTHTTKNPDAERRIWAYPEPYAGIMRTAFQQRMAMQPYIYTEARNTYDTGVGFVHPLYYDYPEAEAAYTNKDEYAFGRELVVAPVTQAVDPASQLASEPVWIPDGEWIEEPTGRHLTGPVQRTRSFSIAQVPVYAKAGAIVPMQPAMLHTGQQPVDPLTLMVYPLTDHQSSSYMLYADGSASEAYKHGVCTWTKLSASQNGDLLTVEIAPVQGAYPGMVERRAYRIELPGDWPPASVSVNGEPVDFAGTGNEMTGWSYQGNTLTTVITTPGFSVHQTVTVRIRRPADSLARRAELDGFAGATERLREAYDQLNALYPALWSPDVLIDAWQTGDRLTYQPQTASTELSRFPRLYQQALAQVQALNAQAQAGGSKLTQQLNDERRTGETGDPLTNYRMRVSRALSLLQDGLPPSAHAE